jgi:CheY-like chemotaxis protein
MERKIRENNYIQSKKMEALSLMAEGLTRRYLGDLTDLSRETDWLMGLTDKANRPLIEGLNNIGDISERLIKTSEELEVFSKRKMDTSGVMLFDLKEAVKRAVDRVQQDLNLSDGGKSGEIEIKSYLRPVSPVRGEPAEIRRAIALILENSLDAVPTGGHLYVSTEENAGQALIYVQDSGKGISEHVAERIFDPFFTTRGDHRNGFGLSLAYAILKRHHGGIEISGNKNLGTTITVKLPIAKEVRQMRIGPIKKRLKNAHILIIENEDMVMVLLSQILGKKGYKIDTVYSDLEGIDKLRKKTFDMVIADTEFMDLRAEDFLQRARKLTPSLAIALIAGREDDRHIEPFERHPADLIVRKPVDINRMVRRIPEVLMQKVLQS